jgi:hypothetical protein
VEGPAVFAEQPLATSSIQVATFPKSNNPPLVIPSVAEGSAVRLAPTEIPGR